MHFIWNQLKVALFSSLLNWLRYAAHAVCSTVGKLKKSDDLFIGKNRPENGGK